MKTPLRSEGQPSLVAPATMAMHSGSDDGKGDSNACFVAFVGPQIQHPRSHGGRFTANLDSSAARSWNDRSLCFAVLV